jgi:hypothetical protein
VFGNYNEHWRIRVDPTSDYDYPAQLALEGWVMLLLGFRLASKRIKAIRLGKTMFDLRRVRSAALILSALGPIAHFAEFQLQLPVVLGGVARLFHGLGYLGIGLMVMEITQGRATFGTKIWLATMTTLLLALQLSTGFISGLVTTAAVILLSFWAVRRKLGWKLIVAAVLITVIALTIKSSTDEFRVASWKVNNDLSSTAKVSLFANLVMNRIEADGINTALRTGWRSSATRSANMDLLADIVRRTPSPVPYWFGRSYVSLIGLAIPRFVWPSKPTKNLGQLFGHRYSLLDTHDTHTSFNLPFLVEFYANFGEAGIVLGMLFVGVIYGVLARFFNNPGQGPLVTFLGIVLMLPVVNIESDFSLIFGGLLMDGTALWLILRYIQERVDDPKGHKAARRRATPAFAFVATNGTTPEQRRLN